MEGDKTSEDQAGKHNELYVALKTHDVDQDYKVTKNEKEGKYEITDLKTNKTTSVDASNFELDSGSILRFTQSKHPRLVQYIDS